MDRRRFLGLSAGMAAAFALTGESAGTNERIERNTEMDHNRGPKKALLLSMLPSTLTTAEKFQLAASVGFEGMEVGPTTDRATVAELRQASRKAKIPIHSIMHGGWNPPLSSPDESAAAQAVKSLEASIKSAKMLGADTVLLVPAVVNATVRYVEAYERSQKRIRQVLPLAEEMGVVIAIENVWNYFLLSPLEFARYVDEFESPHIMAYFDVGNVVGAFGFPQDWIRTLGKRIRRIHLKDFKLDGRKWVNLGEGDVDWREVRTALEEIGYEGFMTTELPTGDEAYLRDLSARIDRIMEHRPKY